MIINVCISSDDNYIKHLAVTVASILKNSKQSDELNFYILDGKISEINKQKVLELEKLKKGTKIEFVSINEKNFKDCVKFSEYHTVPAFYRLKMASLLPNINKIIYLDCDTVVTESLSELFEKNIDDYYMAGVEDIGYFYFHDKYWKYENFDQFYVNSGVLLLNLKKWREDNLEEKFFDYIKNNKDCHSHDQNIINIVAKDKIEKLELKWNVQDSFFRKDERDWHPLKNEIKNAIKNPAIVHFTSQKKPWDNCLIPAAHLYTKYIKYTSFQGKLSESEVFFKNVIYQTKKLLQYPKTFMQHKKNILPRYLAYKITKEFYLISTKNDSKQESLKMESFKYTKFLEVLQQNDFQNKIDNMAKKYKNKKIIIYGTGLICNIIFENFNLEGLDIIAVSDKRYKDETENYRGITAIPPEAISVKNPDIVLITLQDSLLAEDFFKNELFKKTKKLKYRSIFVYSIGDFIKNLILKKVLRKK